MHLDVGVILKINDVVVKDVRHLSSCFCAAFRTIRVVRNDRQNDIIHLHARIFLYIPLKQHSRQLNFHIRNED